MNKESRVKDGNYIVIQSFMVKDLQLKGNELLVYALIYGFSQAEDQKFNGSLQYIADWTNSTKAGVIKNLKSLIEKQLIAKEEKLINNVKVCEYVALTNVNSSKQSLPPNETELPGGSKQSLPGGSKQSLPNNINIYSSNNNIVNNKKKINKRKEETPKSKYGSFENVLLTNDELNKLKQRFPDWHAKIENLSLYIESTGKKYQSHYATILNWANSENKKKGTKPNVRLQQNYNNEYPE